VLKAGSEGDLEIISLHMSNYCMQSEQISTLSADADDVMLHGIAR
jgi:hypothetical protein